MKLQKNISPVIVRQNALCLLWGSFLVTGALLLFLVACRGPETGLPIQNQPARAPSSPQGWEQLVDAAKRESTVVLYAPPGDAYRSALAESFENAYRGMQVQASWGASSDVSRVIAERTAGRYLVLRRQSS